MPEIGLRINGEDFKVFVEDHWTLLDVLRDVIGYTGTKKGCDKGECGACTVILAGKAVQSCLILAVQAQGKEILTIEGLAREGRLDPLQAAFHELGAIQCGFCTPGMIMTAKALLARHSTPSLEEIKRGLAGNLCRCTGYVKIVKAVQRAAGAAPDALEDRES